MWTWIANCLTPEVAAELPPTKDMKGISEKLQEMYGKLDRAKIFSLTQVLSELKQWKFSISVVFNQLSVLWNELEMADEKLERPETTLTQYRAMKEREKVTRFLLILNESYLRFRSKILAMEPMPSLNRIYKLAV